MRFLCGILLGWFAHLYSGNIVAVVNEVIGQVR
jgi:hypothetical protein